MTAVLDLSALVERAGSHHFAREILGDFTHAIASDIETMRAAEHAGDLSNLGRRAHRLRGCLLAIGADRAAEAAGALEDCAAKRDGDASSEALARLLAALVELQETIRSACACALGGTASA